MSSSIAFTQPTFQRMLPLLVGAILARWRRTVTALLRSAGGLAPGHSSDYHRLFSRAAWSLWPLGSRVRLHICGNTRRIVTGMASLGGEIVDLDWMAPSSKLAARPARVRSSRETSTPWPCCGTERPRA